MADVILNRTEILSIMEGEDVDERFSKYIDIGFLPVSLAIDVIEKEKKRGIKTPLGMKKIVDRLPDCINMIPLSIHGLNKALTDDDFADKYIDRTGNPIEFATEASVYEIDGWWNRVELLESLADLSWE